MNVIYAPQDSGFNGVLQNSSAGWLGRKVCAKGVEAGPGAMIPNVSA